jgi:hydrogenase/urease accessory protein HupE
MMRLILILFAVMVLRVLPAGAHEIRPAYLQLDETTPGQYSVLWKVPAAGDLRLGLYLKFPDGCRNISEPFGSSDGAAHIERWQISCEGGLKGKNVSVDGLRSTMTDVLARISWADGSIEIERLTPEAPVLTLKGAQTPVEVARTYFVLGVEHILGGIDHLLFVLALMLLIREPWMLVKTITAFTVAHSITLSGAALGYVSLPPAPVEAVIALSIVFVARELLLMEPGKRRLSESYPWLIAFSFGLLHGFGFAGALKEIGLPHGDVPLALLTFNIGVEIGQLIFVAAMVAIARAAAALIKFPVTLSRAAISYGIGAAATFWLIDRLAGLSA